MRRSRPYINPYLGGALLGLVLFSAFLFTGNGLGASGAVNRVQIAAVDFVAPDHVNRTAYFARTAGGSRNPLAHPSVLMLAGTVLGGLASGLFFGRVRPEIRKGPRITNRTRLILALLGGTIMGYGARMARGCTSGQALSGGAVLSVGSWVFMFAVFGGAYAMAYFLRRAWN
jgi:uncharacterized membrane protein YedE/YeeE